MAGPDLPLLRGSVRRNLTYRAPDAPEHEIEDLIKACGLEELIRTLPDGLDTRIAEGGFNLSAGQRQRLLLARAVLGEPRLLLLDEADANLDQRTIEVMEQLLARRTGTTLLITHDPNRLATVDRVWQLNEGRLVETAPTLGRGC
jgi:ABC-type bacteriocin/lantibiotic exporter with double-glycine peptidase domain